MNKYIAMIFDSNYNISSNSSATIIIGKWYIINYNETILKIRTKSNNYERHKQNTVSGFKNKQFTIKINALLKTMKAFAIVLYGINY